MQTITNDDFEQHSWHDCSLWGIRFVCGDFDSGDFASELVLDVDYITEWLHEPNGRYRFRVAPATLTFHNVTGLKMAMDWGDRTYQVALWPPEIFHIAREPMADQKVHLDRPYYLWRIKLVGMPPAEGDITFGATGFTQVLRAAPIESESQRLLRAQRK